jgi:hypothetical protein
MGEVIALNIIGWRGSETLKHLLMDASSFVMEAASMEPIPPGFVLHGFTALSGWLLVSLSGSPCPPFF